MEDIIGLRSFPFTVIGFFTPNYASLAASLAIDLDVQEASYHLYAIESSEWTSASKMKPLIVLRGMDDYPGRPLVLMDVDCSVSGPLDECVIQPSVDVGVHFRTKLTKKTPKVVPSTRVVSFNPTPAAFRLASEWQNISHIQTNDEYLFMAAIARTNGLSLCMTGMATGVGEYASSSLGNIHHQSAHDASRPLVALAKRFKRWRRDAMSKALGQPYQQWKYGGRPENGP